MSALGLSAVVKPAKGQFQIFYRDGADQAEYVPDFAAETDTAVFLLEPKAADQVDAPHVKAKARAADEWARNASAHAAANGGKPWTYAIIPHDVIAENMRLEGLVARARPR